MYKLQRLNVNVNTYSYIQPTQVLNFKDQSLSLSLFNLSLNLGWDTPLYLALFI